VLNVLLEQLLQVQLVDDEHPVGALGADRAHDPFGVGVHPRKLRRRTQHPGPLGRGDRVECVGELGCAVIPSRCTNRVRTSMTKNTYTLAKFT